MFYHIVECPTLTRGECFAYLIPLLKGCSPYMSIPSAYSIATGCVPQKDCAKSVRFKRADATFSRAPHLCQSPFH